MKNKYNKAVELLLYVIILFLFAVSILYSYFVVDTDFISNVIIVFGITSLLIYIYYSIKNNVFKIWNILILCIIFLLYLSYYYAFDQYVALKGFYNGREGIFVIISYYFIFLLSSTLNDSKIKNNIINLLTTIGIVNIIYGIFQVFDIEYIFNIPVARNWNAASGFLINPDFLTTYTIMLFGFYSIKFFSENKLNIKNILVLGLIIFGLFLTGTMMAIFTLILINIINIFITIIKKQIFLKKLFIYIFLIISSFLIIHFSTSSNIKNDLNNLNYEIKNTIKGDIKDNFGTGRIYIWKEAFNYFPQYIWTGIGIDNFAFLGYKNGTYIYDSALKDNIIYKAHNEYIQILTCEGIFTFIIYCIFMLLVLIRGIYNSKHNGNNSLNTGLLMMIIAYLIQAFFNIRLTLIAPLFFMICGLLVSDNLKE